MKKLILFTTIILLSLSVQVYAKTKYTEEQKKDIAKGIASCIVGDRTIQGMATKTIESLGFNTNSFGALAMMIVVNSSEYGFSEETFLTKLELDYLKFRAIECKLKVESGYLNQYEPIEPL